MRIFRTLPAGLILLCNLSGAAQPPAAPVSLTIEAQPLEAALNAFAQQTGLQVLFPTDETIARLRTARLSGSFTPEAALKQLLAGSGLKYEFVNERTITIRQRVVNPGEQTSGGKSDTASYNVLSGALFVAQQDTTLAQADVTAVPDAEQKSGARRKAGEGEVEEMVVEEKRIKPFSEANVDIPRTVNDPQPYYIFDAKTIERSAALNLEDFLKQRLSMNAAAQSNAQQVSSNFFSNGSSFNLRGLGADKTLVLVNGRRMAGAGWANSAGVRLDAATDINGIPLSAVERIEVLPSSASGIYGAGALGGVINVILKRNYTGGEVRASFDNTWDTDSPSRSMGGTYGAAVGKTQLMFSAQWSDAKSLLLQDRRMLFDRGVANIRRNSPSFMYSNSSPFLGALPNITSASETVNGVTTPDPGTLTLKNGQQLGSRFTYVPAGTAPGTTMAQLSALLYANRDAWNFDLPVSKQDPTGLLRPLIKAPTTTSFALSLARELKPWLDVKLDLSRNTNDADIGTGVSASVLVPAASPMNPFTSAVRITHPSALDPMRELTTSLSSAALELAFKLPNQWLARLDLTWSKSLSRLTSENFDFTYFNNGINNGTLNPFVDLLSYPLASQVTPPFDSWENGSTVKDFSLRGSGPFLSLPWGTPTLTAGVEHRIASSPETIQWSPLIKFFAKEQAFSSVYGEMLIPLVEQAKRPLLHALELQLSAREERYIGDAGSNFIQPLDNGTFNISSPVNGAPYFTKSTYSTNSNTVGIKFMPLSTLTVRLSTASAFVPPLPNQLLKNPLPNTNLTAVVDPRNGNSTVQVSTISGGNPDLTPQNSESFNAGVIWEPKQRSLEGLRLNLEYYNIEQFDAIGSLPAQTLVNEENTFPGRVIRNAAGVITMVDTSSLNLYRRDTEGWDISADYVLKTGIGTFDVHGVGSIILGLKNQYSLTLPYTDAVNFPSEGGAAKYKSNMQINWSYKSWMAGWATAYFGSYKQIGALGGPAATSRRATNPTAALFTTYTDAQGGDVIPSQIYHDMYVSYSFAAAADGRKGSRGLMAGLSSGVTVQLGVKNVFNALPPFDVSYDYYISPYGNTRLRSYWLSAKKSF